MDINIKEQLLKEIEKTPNNTLKEVLDFLLFVRSRKLQQEQFVPIDRAMCNFF